MTRIDTYHTSSLTSIWDVHSFQDPSLKDKKIVVVTSFDNRKRANAAFLMVAFMVIVHRVTPEKAYLPLTKWYPPILPFRDVTQGEFRLQSSSHTHPER